MLIRRFFQVVRETNKKITTLNLEKTLLSGKAGNAFFSLKRVKWILSRVLGGHLNVQSVLCFSSAYKSISRLDIVAHRHRNDDGMEEKALL